LKSQTFADGKLRVASELTQTAPFSLTGQEREKEEIKHGNSRGRIGLKSLCASPGLLLMSHMNHAFDCISLCALAVGMLRAQRLAC
jgi:hypothetical protein